MQIDWQDKGKATPKIEHDVIKNLLFFDGSLSRYLQSLCKGQLKISIQSESWSLPFEDERITLGLSSDEKAFVRLSCLQSDNKKLVNARTVIPEQTYTLIKDQLKALGERPLGELLFSNSSGYRSDMKYAKIPFQCEWFKHSQLEQNVDEVYWGRQSIFIINDMPLLITEVFLPDIHQCLK